MVRFLLSLFLLTISTFYVNGQITTSSISGTLKGGGEGLSGASIYVLHVPSGTEYGAITQNNGDFDIPNMRVGGPYTIEASYLGYEAKTLND